MMLFERLCQLCNFNSWKIIETVFFCSTFSSAIIMVLKQLLTLHHQVVHTFFPMSSLYSVIIQLFLSYKSRRRHKLLDNSLRIPMYIRYGLLFCTYVKLVRPIVVHAEAAVARIKSAAAAILVGNSSSSSKFFYAQSAQTKGMYIIQWKNLECLGKSLAFNKTRWQIAS